MVERTSMHGAAAEELDPSIRAEHRDPSDFYKKIERPGLEEKLTPHSPWNYVTMEIYYEDIAGQGGLGMLASDTLKVAKERGIPMTFLTPFYPLESHQAIDNLYQHEELVQVTPQQRGFEKVDEVQINTLGNKPTKLYIYEKQYGSVTVYAVTEPNFGKLYQGENNSDHRVYQEVSLGFGGYAFLKKRGIDPSMNQQLNEAPTVFSALARLDDHIDKVSGNFDRALAEVKDKTFYTNHTLVQAVEAELSIFQIEKYVIPNLRHEEVKKWLRDKVNGKGGRIKLSTLAIELSGKRNGVSKIHAKVASQTYEDYMGNKVEFESITNGIALNRWGQKDLMYYYKATGVFDEFGLPAPNLAEKLADLPEDKLRELKLLGRSQAREYLKTRKDQYGNPVDIPPEAVLGSWRRRFAGYKQPEKLFRNPEAFAGILENGNIHIVMAGKAHPNDGTMQEKLHQLLTIIDSNPKLKERVHFVQDYDEKLGRALTGVDFSINTPTVIDESGNPISTEACGTSWMKDILNLSVLISTEDGGVADPAITAEQEGTLDSYTPHYLKVSGKNYDEEAQSLYGQIERASTIIHGKDENIWGEFVKRQLEGYLPIISGSRMAAVYLQKGYPAASVNQSAKAA